MVELKEPKHEEISPFEIEKLILRSSERAGIQSLKQESVYSQLSEGWMDAKASLYKIAKDKIFIADDQHINIEVLKEHFEQL